MTADDQGRVVVSEILESSDAYRRGLRYGDQVLSFGGREITSVNGFKNVLGIFPRGWRVPLSFRHEDERHDVMVRLTGVHSREELLAKVERAPQAPPGQPPAPKKRPGEKRRRRKKTGAPRPGTATPHPPAARASRPAKNRRRNMSPS